MGAHLFQSSSIERLEERRLLSFGDIDTAWATNGRVITPFGDDILVSGGKIYAAGNQGVSRYTPDGKLDTTFAKAGTLAFPPMTLDQIAVDPSNRIVITGIDANEEAVIRRYRADGAPDTTFGRSAKRVLGSRSFDPRSVAVQADGKVVVAGTYANSKIRIIRLQATGKLDATFSSDGIADLQLGTKGVKRPRIIESLAAMRVLDSGKILLAGITVSFAPQYDRNNFLDADFGPASFAAARLTASGTLDTTYWPSGIRRVNFENGNQISRYLNNGLRSIYSLGVAAAITGSGELIIAARGEALEAVKLNSAGEVVFHSEPQPGYPIGIVSNVVTLADGRAVIAGGGINGLFTHGPVLATISSTGQIGTWVTTDDLKADTADLYGFSGVALAPDGEII